MTANKVLAFNELDDSLTAIQVPEISLAYLHREIWQIHNLNLNTQERYQRLIELLTGLTNASGCVIFVADPDGNLAIGPRILARQLTHSHADVINVLGQLAEQSRQQQKLLIESLPGSPEVHLLATPIISADEHKGQDVITMALILRSQPVETFATVLQLISGTANLASDNTVEQCDNHYNLVKRIQSFPGLDEAGAFIVDSLTAQYNCTQVMLVLQGVFNKPKLQSVSGQSVFDHRSEMTRLVQSAAMEVLSIRQMQTYQSGQTKQPFLQAIAEQLAVEKIVAIPLSDFQGDIFGVVILLWKIEDNMTSLQQISLQKQLEVIGGGLQGKRKGYPGILQGLHQRLWLKAKKQQRLATLIVPLVVLAIMLFPIDFIISANSIVQPVQRRFIAARFDGVLEKSYVRPGDVVTADQLLARLDGRELQWQLSGLQADRSKALKNRDRFLAAGDTPAAQMARLEIERIKVQADLLSYQNQHLEIRSPISGLVLVGDLQREEGVSVQRGQKLFEIAPLDKVLVEVAIPADEIRHYREGMPVSIYLESFPGKVWEKPLTRLFPSSIIRDGDNTFLGEIELDNSNGLFRPGMRGRANLNAGSKPLIWVWLRKPLAKINEWIFW